MLVRSFSCVSEELEYPSQEQVVDEELEFLVLASDGLWDVVTNEVSFFKLTYFTNMINNLMHVTD